MASSHPSSSGYGPSSVRNRLYFSGNTTDFKIWETRFTNYIYTLDKGVHKALLPPKTGETDDEDFEDKNRRAYAELVQLLDERSLMLIMNDHSNDGRAAFAALCAHYDSKEKPRILTLYEELTTLRLTDNENITDYIIRAEGAATGLRSAGENISDNLIIAMILKGLPEMYKPFIVVHTQLDKYKTVSEFKSALVNYCNTEALRAPMAQSCAMSSAHKPSEMTRGSRSNLQCLACAKYGHRSKDCRSKANLKCGFCKKPGHVDAVCFAKRKHSTPTHQSASYTHTSDTESFSFTTQAYSQNDTNSCNSNKLLVDCGATSHIVNNENLFVSFDKDFNPENHYIELADGRRSNQFAKARGDAKFTIKDAQGLDHDITLKNALYVPDFPIHLFSVRVATDAGATFTFSKENTVLSHKQVDFKIIRSGNLYFLPTQSTCSQTYVTRSLNEWHHVLGHMNFDDILQLQKVCLGMKVTKSDKNHVSFAMKIK